MSISRAVSICLCFLISSAYAEKTANQLTAPGAKRLVNLIGYQKYLQFAAGFVNFNPKIRQRLSSVAALSHSNVVCVEGGTIARVCVKTKPEQRDIYRTRKVPLIWRGPKHKIKNILLKSKNKMRML